MAPCLLMLQVRRISMRFLRPDGGRDVIGLPQTATPAGQTFPSRFSKPIGPSASTRFTDRGEQRSRRARFRAEIPNGRSVAAANTAPARLSRDPAPV